MCRLGRGPQNRERADPPHRNPKEVDYRLLYSKLHFFCSFPEFLSGVITAITRGFATCFVCADNSVDYRFCNQFCLCGQLSRLLREEACFTYLRIYIDELCNMKVRNRPRGNFERTRCNMSAIAIVHGILGRAPPRNSPTNNSLLPLTNGANSMYPLKHKMMDYECTQAIMISIALLHGHRKANCWKSGKQSL